MISLVRNNQIFNILFLIPYAIIVRLYSILNPRVYEVTGRESRLSQWIFELLGDNPLVHTFFSIIITIGIAVVLSILCNRHRIYTRPNLLASYLFVLLSSLIAEVQLLSPALIALLFFTLYLRSCMMIYRYHLGFFELFNMGFFAMLSGMLYPPFYMLLFASLFVILFFEGFEPKKFLLFLFGAASVAIIQVSLFFFFDSLHIREGEMLGPSSVLFDASFWSLPNQVFVSLLAVLTLFGISRYYSSLKKKIIDARKRISFLFLITILVLLIPVFFTTADIHYFVIVSFLAAILLSLHFDGQKNAFSLEGLHLVLLVILFAVQFNIINTL